MIEESQPPQIFLGNEKKDVRYTNDKNTEKYLGKSTQYIRADIVIQYVDSLQKFADNGGVQNKIAFDKAEAELLGLLPSESQYEREPCCPGLCDGACVR